MKPDINVELEETNKACQTIRITGFVDFVRRSKFWKHDGSETGSLSVIWWGEVDIYCVGSL
jgi:hypothetical protein